MSISLHLRRPELSRWPIEADEIAMLRAILGMNRPIDADEHPRGRDVVFGTVRRDGGSIARLGSLSTCIRVSSSTRHAPD
jgi:hypothetical protein